MKIRRHVFKVLSAALFASVLSGCANSTGLSGLFGGGDADDNEVKIEGCVSKVSATLVTELDSLNYVIQDCLGDALTHDAKMVRSEVAVLLLANYGTRVIGTVKAIDEDAAAEQALVLKHRIEKAMTKLNSIRTPGTLTTQELDIRKVFPNYRPLAVRQAGDVQLFGVARAAFSPLAWRARETLRAYIKSASGGLGSLLRKALDRRKIGLVKFKNASQTLTLGKVAMFDTRCLLGAIDYQLLSAPMSTAEATAYAFERSKEVNETRSDEEKAEDELRCDVTSYPGNLHVLAWDKAEDWLAETVKALDTLADPS